MTLAAETAALLREIDARKPPGMSDIELSGAAGMSDSFIKNLRQGKQRTAGIAAFAGVARALRCSIDDLIPPEIARPPRRRTKPQTNDLVAACLEVATKQAPGAELKELVLAALRAFDGRAWTKDAIAEFMRDWLARRAA